MKEPEDVRELRELWERLSDDKRRVVMDYIHGLQTAEQGEAVSV